MSCTNPQCAMLPLRGGSPIFSRQSDFPAGETFLHPVHGMVKVIYLPCGGCLSCRRERRQELTLLQCCEASLHDDNWFITLTYDDAYFAARGESTPVSLVKSHFSGFLQLMRKYCSYYGHSFRYFGCGEYGETYHRPHYHLSVFGLPPDILGLPSQYDVRTASKRALYDFAKLSKTYVGTYDDNGYEFWHSPVISIRWPYGAHKIYRANRETFQYVAGYVTKKLTGAGARDFRASGLISEYQVQSRPSIGRPWFDRYIDSIAVPNKAHELVNDCVSIAGIQWRCPRIFSKWLASMDFFDGKRVADYLSHLRSLECPTLPDRADLTRKVNFERYRTAQFKQNNKHKEVQ